MVPFATFCPDPEAHDFFGMSIADTVMDIQRIKSSSCVTRSTAWRCLSTHAWLSPRAWLISMTLCHRGRRIIRQRSAGQVQPLSMPFVGQQAFPVLQYMDEIKEARTGISKASAWA
jgi:hypothetical protein